MNATQLDRELREAGVAILGCDSDGNVSFAPEATEADFVRASEVVSSHKPLPFPLTGAEDTKGLDIERRLSAIEGAINVGRTIERS